MRAGRMGMGTSVTSIAKLLRRKPWMNFLAAVRPSWVRMSR